MGEMDDTDAWFAKKQAEQSAALQEARAKAEAKLKAENDEKVRRLREADEQKRAAEERARVDAELARAAALEAERMRQVNLAENFFLRIYFQQLFGARRRRMPRARSNRRVASERSGRDASLGTLRSTAGPSAFAVGMLRDVRKTDEAGRIG